jgi:hypothetical protein
VIIEGSFWGKGGRSVKLNTHLQPSSHLVVEMPRRAEYCTVGPLEKEMRKQIKGKSKKDDKTKRDRRK